jgi:hypothetical protein
MDRHSAWRWSVLVAFIALVAAACGGGAVSAPPTTPAASPTVAPSPTATPIDVAAAFRKIVTDPAFAGRWEIDATIEMGITVGMTGTIEGAGSDSHSTTTIDVAGTKTTQESISVGGKSWKRTVPGPWLEAPASSSSSESSLGAWLKKLATIEDAGVETRDGVKLHHLRATGGSDIPPEAIGIDPAQFKNAKLSIEMYALDDGTPALFVIDGKWVQKVNAQDITVEFTMDMKAKDVGKTIKVSAPDDVWTPFTSKLGYAASRPDGADLASTADGDSLTIDGQDWLFVGRYDAKGMSATGFRDAILKSYKEQGAEPREAPVATKVAGGEAFEIAFAGQSSAGVDVVVLDVVFVHGEKGWEISFVTDPAHEAADRADLAAFLTTFAFTK